MCVQEDRLLTKLIKLYGTRNWSLIANGIKGRSGKSCRLRYAATHGALKTSMPTHVVQQIASSACTPALLCFVGRWHNQLDPSVVKTPFTDLEDAIIVRVSGHTCCH